MIIRSRIFALAAVALLGVAPAPAVFAETQAVFAQAQADEPAMPQQDIPSYSDSELRSFAVAMLEVQHINDVYLPRLEAAATREEQEQVLQTAGDEMTQVVQKHGLSVDRFTQILNHAQQDPGLADRVRHHIEEAR